MDSDAKLLMAQFICERCGKAIRSPKVMTIKKRHYHMVCGMNEKFGERAKVKA